MDRRMAERDRKGSEGAGREVKVNVKPKKQKSEWQQLQRKKISHTIEIVSYKRFLYNEIFGALWIIELF